MRPGAARTGRRPLHSGAGVPRASARDKEVQQTDTFGSHKKEKKSSLHIHNALFIVYTRLGMIYWVGYIHMNNDVK